MYIQDKLETAHMSLQKNCWHTCMSLWRHTWDSDIRSIFMTVSKEEVAQVSNFSEWAGASWQQTPSQVSIRQWVDFKAAAAWNYVTQSSREIVLDQCRCVFSVIFWYAEAWQCCRPKSKIDKLLDCWLFGRDNRRHLVFYSEDIV